MSASNRTWAVALAAGDGTRLAAFTRDAGGNVVPKQFCSLNGGQPLLHHALQRARHVAPHERVCAIVSRDHARYWRRALHDLPGGNIIVQPHNRGTAHGVLLSVLAILERDPLARIVFLPADHFVLDENALARALRDLALHLGHNPEALTLIGIEPDDADPELGYILPGRALSDGSLTVERFIEKPPPLLAQRLIDANALWNSFIFAATGATLLALLRARLAASVDDMSTALARDAYSSDSAALTELYERLPAVDFSREVVQHGTMSLRVVRAPACGWNDLGTPRRVTDTLRRLAAHAAESRAPRPHVGTADDHWSDAPALINFAERHARMALTG
jgi:mannose-1-phosphate guanylyltransferase